MRRPDALDHSVAFLKLVWPVVAVSCLVGVVVLTGCSGVDVRTPFVSVEVEPDDPVFESRNSGIHADSHECEWKSSAVQLPKGTTFSFACGSGSTVIQNQTPPAEAKITSKPDGTQDVSVSNQEAGGQDTSDQETARVESRTRQSDVSAENGKSNTPTSGGAPAVSVDGSDSALRDHEIPGREHLAPTEYHPTDF